MNTEEVYALAQKIIDSEDAIQTCEMLSTIMESDSAYVTMLNVALSHVHIGFELIEDLRNIVPLEDELHHEGIGHVVKIFEVHKRRVERKLKESGCKFSYHPDQQQLECAKK